MAMKKSIWMVLVIIMLVVSSQLCIVQSRVLRSEELKTQVVENREGVKGEASSSSSSSKLSIIRTRPSNRSLAFRLASGPSKKGRGH
ncbi:hypothetical protein HN51_053068 [Arachis hypogaea]|uniref:Uncharacterized protein n=1 Tax=Arachis hypogaea TaxID=3818 RepID=A0A445C883_ARAHY|nr:hypothetical protein Ahy_A07g033090 [Arachis hypogaea]